MALLTVSDHSRDAAQMTYVYPVISRRAGGVSVGINLSPNNACNFRCIYCQVPDLVRGVSPSIDLEKLERELQVMLEDIVHGDFLRERVPEGARVLRDVAFSGNGEPTSSANFRAAVGVVGRELKRRGLAPQLPVVLITNGTLLGKPLVIEAIEDLARIGGRVWFKLDGVSREAMQRINDTPLDAKAHIDRLRETARRIPTWVQTCIFSFDGQPPSSEEREQYLSTLGQLVAEGVPLKGVLLYSLARESMQPEVEQLRRLSRDEMRPWSEGITSLGLEVSVSA